MKEATRNGTLTGSPAPFNAPAPFPFHLSRRLVASFPIRHRAYLSALYTLLIAASRRGEDFVTEPQTEIARELGLSLRLVRNLEAELEELGALHSHQAFLGPGKGRALELLPVEEWAQAGVRRPVENFRPPAPGAGPPGTWCRGSGENMPLTARARQSIPEERLTRTPASAGARADHAPGRPAPARRMFGFLSKATGLSARRWAQAIPELERKIRERGEEWTWNEVERIAVAARAGINPGGYAYSCLFPDGLPKTRGSALRALDGRGDAGPLFAGLEPTSETRSEEPSP